MSQDVKDILIVLLLFRPSAIVARALENFLVFIEVPNLDVLCKYLNFYEHKYFIKI